MNTKQVVWIVGGVIVLIIVAALGYKIVKHYQNKYAMGTGVVTMQNNAPTTLPTNNTTAKSGLSNKTNNSDPQLQQDMNDIQNSLNQLGQDQNTSNQDTNNQAADTPQQ